MVTSAIRAVVCVDVDTAISTMITAVSIVGFVITKTVSNNRGSKPSNTVFLMATIVIRAVICVDVDTATSTIKVTLNWLTLSLQNPFLNNVTLSEQFKKIDMYNLELFNFCGKQMKARTGFS